MSRKKERQRNAISRRASERAESLTAKEKEKKKKRSTNFEKEKKKKTRPNLKMSWIGPSGRSSNTVTMASSEEEDDRVVGWNGEGGEFIF